MNVDVSVGVSVGIKFARIKYVVRDSLSTTAELYRKALLNPMCRKTYTSTGNGYFPIPISPRRRVTGTPLKECSVLVLLGCGGLISSLGK